MTMKHASECGPPPGSFDDAAAAQQVGMDDDLVFEDLEARHAPEAFCSTSTSCCCTSTSCLAWSA